MSTYNRILHIKNMVCPRCKLAVKKIFEGLGCNVHAVELGQVVIKSDNIPAQEQIRNQLVQNGFELLESEEARLVERIKVMLISLLYWSGPVGWPVALTMYLEMGTQKKFKELNRLFFSICGCTIREYFKLLRFERAKELISYHERPIHHIAGRLGYGNYKRLALEFNRRLNLDLTEFIKSENNYRLPLDRIIQA